MKQLIINIINIIIIITCVSNAASNVINQYGIQVSYTHQVCSPQCISHSNSKLTSCMHYKTLQHKYNLQLNISFKVNCAFHSINYHVNPISESRNDLICN